MAIYPYFDSSSSRKPPVCYASGQQEKTATRVYEDIKKGMQVFPASLFHRCSHYCYITALSA